MLKIAYPCPEEIADLKARHIQSVWTAQALVNAGADVDFYYGESGTGWDRIRRKIGIRRKQTPAPIPIRRKWTFGALHCALNSRFYFSLGRALEKRPCDAFFVRHLKTAKYLMKRFKDSGIPLVFEVHEFFSTTAGEDGREEKAIELQALESEAFGGADGLVFLTQAMQKIFNERFGSGIDSIVLPDGVDLSAYKSSGAERDIDIIYAGSFHPWKGVDVLIRAVKFVPGAVLTVVGGDSARLAQMLELAEESGVSDSIRFVGPAAPREIPGLLMRSKVAVLPNVDLSISRVATSPLKLFEAMAAGCRIVASDLPSLREVLSDKSAITVPPGNAEALGEALRYALSNDPALDRKSQEAKRQAIKYSWDERGRKLLGFFNSLSGVKNTVAQ